MMSENPGDSCPPCDLLDSGSCFHLSGSIPHGDSPLLGDWGRTRGLQGSKVVSLSLVLRHCGVPLAWPPPGPLALTSLLGLSLFCALPSPPRADPQSSPVSPAEQLTPRSRVQRRGPGSHLPEVYSPAHSCRSKRNSDDHRLF